MKFAVVLMMISAAAGQQRAPKHIYNLAEPITAASGQAPREIGRQFIEKIAADFGLSPQDLAGVYVVKEYQTAHNGVTHLIYAQQYRGLEVHNADYRVNIDRQGRVINAGGMLYGAPAPEARVPDLTSSTRALHAAIAAVSPSAAESYMPFATAADEPTKTIRYHRGALGDEVAGRAVWFAVNGILRPAWVYQIVAENGIDSYETVVDDDTLAVFANEPMTFFQSGPRGLVFTGSSPQPNPKPGTRVASPPPVVNRSMVSFTGDSVASPKGWVSNNETAGNNAVVAPNQTGIRFWFRPQTITGPNGDFSYPLELGRDAPAPMNFAAASTVNLFYWINRTHDLFHQVGFDEAAGNFQQDNLGRGGVGGDPVYGYSHFGSASPSLAQLNNAFFSWRSPLDGVPCMIAMFLGSLGGFFSDGSLDSEVIIHEYTHGVSARLLRGYGSFQTSSMGEAWSDFFALEFTVPEGAPPDGHYATAEYLFQSFGPGLRTRPYSTNMEINSLTFADLGRVISLPEVHADGEIWVEALWEMRANLIRQFGEKEGRRRARLLVIDGMKLSPPAPSYINARDAILMADRVDFDGASQAQIWEAFAKRGMGILAHSNDGNTVHVLPSFERPSPAASMKLYEPQYTLGETVRVVLQDANNNQDSVAIQLVGSSGDLETLVLRKSGPLFTGSIGTTGNTGVTRGDAVLSLVPGDYISAYYVDHNTGSGAKLVEASAPVAQGYTLSLAPSDFRFNPETRLNFQAGFLSFRRYDLPFELPFFGKKHSSVYLFSNGLITFGLPVPTPCTDVPTLNRFQAIAPLWMELRTNGRAQPNEDIYVSTTPDTVTFRWAAEVETFSTQPGEPVNFSATLYRDGRIQFSYGSGNRNLANGLRFAGCFISTPTVGISPGTETYTQILGTHTGLPNLENAPMVTLDPPFHHPSIPQARLESPVPDERFQSIIRGRGVTWDEQGTVTRIDVMIDGRFRARAFRTVMRPDFCSGQNVRGCPLVGFEFNLNIAALELAPGPHTMQLKLTNNRGAMATVPEQPVTFHIDPGQARAPFGRVEAPAGGAEVTGPVTVRGWAAANDLRVVSVDVLIDGVTASPAQYGIARTDVCDTLSPRPLNCPAIGFSATVSPTAPLPLSNGEHKLQIRTMDETGRYTLIPDEPLTIVVKIEPNQLPRGVLVTPVNNERVSGMLHISGHAWDPDGRVVGVDLLIDGEFRATIPYGRPRPQECESLPDVEACPNIGFELDFDTRRLFNGPHALGIRIRDNRGGAPVIPDTLRRGINITVLND
jgi:hypothetical protein